ncbi:phospholipase DDHD2-like isoform X1 [Penaeus chinensis]|uniref:phospholipase DDHD2-like isoform X1 n=1 Tax=Penaeus chinensis TaxID=139456 RepID=UPI001FB652B0|nr:phospholipase DDHD2-like isoform X1 [Penaeus chinensis]
MANRQTVNPLLFSANSSTAFDNFPTPAVLIPPSQNETHNASNDVEEADSFLGQGVGEGDAAKLQTGTEASQDLIFPPSGTSGISPGPPAHHSVTSLVTSGIQPLSSVAPLVNPTPGTTQLPIAPRPMTSSFPGVVPPLSRPTSLDPPVRPPTGPPLSLPPLGPPPVAPVSSVLPIPPASTPSGGIQPSVSPALNSVVGPPPTGFSPNFQVSNGADQKGSNFLRRPRNKYVAQQPLANSAKSPSSLMPSGGPYSTGAEDSLSPSAPSNMLPTPTSVYGSPMSSFSTNSISPTNNQSPVNSMFSSISSIPFGTSPEDIKLSSVNLGPQPGQTSVPPSSTQEGSSTSQATVIPASFENMASNPPSQDGMYHPVMHHWFYAVGQPPIWKPFSFTDSFNLEDAHRTGSTDILATDGGRHDVCISERLRRAVFWDDTEPCLVRRCSWFKKGPLDAQPTPYEEDVAEKLEEDYRDAVISGRWHKQVDLKDGDRIMIHSTRVMLHYQGVEGDFPTGISVNGSQAPLTVKRGTEDFDISDGEAEKIDHLLFLVHGIGSVCDLRFRPVEQCVDDFRKLGQQLLSTHFKQSVDMGVIGRVEILPVSWHKALHGDATGIDEKLKPITLRSIPKLREFTNDTILDVLLFTSPIYCQHIVDTVASELNRLYTLFCERNPSFSGPVSLGGHSLGSVILFDLLMHQSPNAEDSPNTDPSPAVENHSICSRDRTDSVTSPVNYVMGGQGTGQPSITYPQISFKPDAFFLMGSPIGMFITVRGIDTIGVDFELPTCKRVFNIFHPFDPVAYRLETLVDPSLIDLRPVLIPHHKGRKRMHLELKETIERVGTEVKQKIVDSIQSTWNRLYEFYSGSSTSANTSLEKEVDEALAEKLFLSDEESQQGASGELKIPVGRLNQGRRIDYVLQEKPYESFNEYIFALQAHVTYWESEDTMLLILKELYVPQGITCDNEQSQLGQQITHGDGDSALGSGSLSPSSPPMFDTASMTLSHHGSKPTAPTPPPSDPVPLFTSPPTCTAAVDHGVNPLPEPSLNTMPLNQACPGPRIIGGRPVISPDSQSVGMDPTVKPAEKPPLGPPPKMQPGSFVRASPFRR